MDSLIRFVQQAEQDDELQIRIQQASSASELVQLAATLGYELSRDMLRSRSRDLSATYWPWAGKTNSWRRTWFEAG
ncbi:MAG: Nif11-like leader peptide family natural product precursor [Cyanobacteriota bacterium]|nr:Nif11-like leader peptide family natural product precursor [Cyanobacteriota bacterium]